MKVLCMVAFDYLTVGETYTVEAGKRYTYFSNVRTGGATSVSSALYRHALRIKCLVVVE